ncbi:hypothetical protein WISP_67914 [Willisornis vidua]|uniref:Uncharacterized protein n=1 Tax=Willisornis vidua TaxID=1566151 RepID=A0ABQ9DD76_9PASS|nr:hypothetical protein WISP_67914 [Willisornis vidua]
MEKVRMRQPVAVSCERPFSGTGVDDTGLYEYLTDGGDVPVEDVETDINSSARSRLTLHSYTSVRGLVGLQSNFCPKLLWHHTKQREGDQMSFSAAEGAGDVKLGEKEAVGRGELLLSAVMWNEDVVSEWSLPSSNLGNEESMYSFLPNLNQQTNEFTSSLITARGNKENELAIGLVFAIWFVLHEVVWTFSDPAEVMDHKKLSFHIPHFLFHSTKDDEPGKELHQESMPARQEKDREVPDGVFQAGVHVNSSENDLIFGKFCVLYLMSFSQSVPPVGSWPVTVFCCDAVVSQVISSPVLILSTPAEVHLEEQVIRNEQSQSVLCMYNMKWKESGEAGAGLVIRHSLWYTGLDGAAELPFPAKTSVVRYIAVDLKLM